MSRVTRSRPAGESLALVEASDADAGCGSRLADADDVLVLAFERTPREWLAARDAPPTDVRFVATYPHPDCVRTLSDPGDLQAVALAVSRFLDSVDAGATPGVCVDALEPLCRYASPQRVARFFAVVAGRVRAAGGTVHCHADADAGALESLPEAGVLFDGRQGAAVAADASAD